MQEETGKVFGEGDLGPVIEGIDVNIENSIWVASNHKCVPIYLGYEKAGLSVEELKKNLLK